MKKIGLIILIAIVALGAMGAAYAAWGQTFNVTGTVSTGTYAVAIGPGTPPTVLPEGQTVATINGGDGINPGPDFTNTNTTTAGFSVTIANAYPGFSYTVPYILTSTGSVPAYVSGFTVTTITANGDNTTAAYNGSATLNIILPGGTVTDVEVTNTLAIPILGNMEKDHEYAGTLTITIPDLYDSTNHVNLDATGTNATASQTFNFQIVTAQNSQ